MITDSNIDQVVNLRFDGIQAQLAKGGIVLRFYNQGELVCELSSGIMTSSNTFSIRGLSGSLPHTISGG